MGVQPKMGYFFGIYEISASTPWGFFRDSMGFNQQDDELFHGC
jgi:hypothetical protein